MYFIVSVGKFVVDISFDLPLSLRSSVDAFKSKVKTHLFLQAF